MVTALTTAGLTTVARTGGQRCGIHGTHGAPLRRAAVIAIISAYGLIPALSDPRFSSVPQTTATPALAPKPLEVIQGLGNKAGADAREGKLLSRQGPNRQPGAYDPFRVAIRGRFRGLPPVKIMLAPSPPKPAPGVAAKPNLAGTASALAGVNAPTWERAVDGLAIGAVNEGARELLIGPQLVREGDLMIVQLEGKSFPVWVRRVGDGEVEFCDAELRQNKLRTIRTVPKDLPESTEDELTAGTLFLRAK
jgi:hypothetical protein